MGPLNSTCTSPIHLVLSRLAPEFTLGHTAHRQLVIPTTSLWEDTLPKSSGFKLQCEGAAEPCASSVRTQLCRTYSVISYGNQGGFVLLDFQDDEFGTVKLAHHVPGPFSVLSLWKRTATIQRGKVVVRVSLERLVITPNNFPTSEPSCAATSKVKCPAKNSERHAWEFERIVENGEKSDGSP